MSNNLLTAWDIANNAITSAEVDIELGSKRESIDRIDDLAFQIDAYTSRQNAKLANALQSVIENDKTYYNHHDPRPDGRLPKENGGTIWLTPKEIARRALSPSKETSDV